MILAWACPFNSKGTTKSNYLMLLFFGPPYFSFGYVTAYWVCNTYN